MPECNLSRQDYKGTRDSKNPFSYISLTIYSWTVRGFSHKPRVKAIQTCILHMRSHPVILLFILIMPTVLMNKKSHPLTENIYQNQSKQTKNGIAHGGVWQDKKVRPSDRTASGEPASDLEGTHLRRDTVIPQWFQASKAAAASDGHAVHC